MNNIRSGHRGHFETGWDSWSKLIELTFTLGAVGNLEWFCILRARIETNLVQQPTASKGGFRNWYFQPGLRSHDEKRPQWPSCGGTTCHLLITTSQVSSLEINP